MPPIRIIPRYKMLLSYNIRPECHDTYYEYVLKEFVPALQEMGLYMIGAWTVSYGPYPERHVEFVSESLEDVHMAFQSSRFQELEDRLMEYTYEYDRKVVKFRSGFQF